MSSGSGFPGGGSDFNIAAGFGNRFSANTLNNPPPQPPFRSQLPGIFLDPSSQIVNRSTSLMGKRTLSEFQQNQQIGDLFLRSVKHRMYNQTSPISPLSPIEFPSILSPEQRYGLPLPQLRPQPVSTFGNGNLTAVSYMKAVQNQVLAQESEKKLMNRLQELEKQLLDDDNDENEGDAVSVITNTNSEWSEAIQNLISPTSSPSSSSSSSMASPPARCSTQCLIEAASAISEAKMDVANEIVMRLAQMANAKGNSEQRLTEYMLSALKSRMDSGENPPPVGVLYGKDHVVSTQMLYELSPCFKLGFMAANLAIIEATLSGEESNAIEKFHVIDFDIGQGGQYMNLLHALSTRQNCNPVAVKLTTVADAGEGDEENLKSVGDMLSQLAKRLGITFNFNVVTQKLTGLTRDSLGCEPDEPLAVNFAFKLHQIPDESVSTENPRDELLRRVKGLSPRVVTLVEQELNTNTAPFMARVNETCSYYGALFDSLDSTESRDNLDRVKVEEGLGRKLVNSVACEGSDRVERCEVFGKWRARMGMAGFELKPMSQIVAESMRARLSAGNRLNPGFTVKEENGGVCFGWMNRTLTFASAWR